MSGNFSFSNSDIFALLTKAHQIVPGIGKIITIQYSKNKQKTEAYTLLQPSNPLSVQDVVLDDSVLEAIDEFRMRDIKFSWHAEEDLPFNLHKQKIKQLDVFNELERNILMLGIKNDADKKNDLLIFYFNENISNFAISNSNKSLTPENKIIIGSLLYNSLQMLLDVMRHDRKTLENYNRNVNYVISTMKDAQNANSDFKEKHDNVLLNYAYEILSQSELARHSGKMVLTESAINKIKSYEGEISTLKNIITQAAFFASNLNIGSAEQTIYIEDYHLNFEAAKADKTQIAAQVNSRYQKTISLLDKLEEAAQDVQRKNKMLTGINVGSACKKAISAPAISDALKKHRSKIITLLKDHPDRWNLIRTEFKPLINVLTPRHNHLDDIAKQA